MAERYRGHILGYIIWNEPNLAAEWSRSGGDLPHHSNEFSPRAVDDREFLRRMYAAGCFDVLAVHDYGYGLSPDDERGAHGGLNLARILDLRDAMLDYGDIKPVWITELGYTIHSHLQPTVSQEEQAAYVNLSFPASLVASRE